VVKIKLGMVLRQATIMLALLTILPAQAVTQQDYDIALAQWAEVLTAFVNEEGQTDFAALAGQKEALLVYVDFVATVSPQSHPLLFPTPADVLAYHINTYNALAMYGVIDEELPANFDSFFKRLSFFKLRDIRIGGKSTSLYDYENDVIRSLNEPRIHFALNCMVKDCPRLPMVPFDAAELDAQLSELTWQFFNKEKHLRIDSENKIVYVSEILDFYTEDFVVSGDQQDLLAYINRYQKVAIPADYQVEFIDYDWTINQQP
jgi:hypothetical protein